MPDGQYELGGQDVFLKGGIAKLADGTIAGSATAPEYFTADVYYEGESIPELVKVGIKKDNVGSSDAELASITSIFNKITGNSHTKIWS